MPLIEPLPPRLDRLSKTGYLRGFSKEEIERRRAGIDELVRQAGCDHLVFCGANRVGSVVQWLTQWPVTAEAVGVLSPGEQDALFVQFVKSSQNWQALLLRTPRSHGAAHRRYRRRSVSSRSDGLEPGRIAFIGPMSYFQHSLLTDAFGPPTDLNQSYTKMRQVKSAEELDWLRIGAYFADLGMAGLRANLRPGINEQELGACIEEAYVVLGGSHYIHFVGTTSMHDPCVPVPRQFPSRRQLSNADVVCAEISASFWDYPGQVLRSFTIGEEPNQLYRDLHAAADAAFVSILRVLKAGATPREVIEASGVIEDAGFTIIDDLLHGFGGGYLPPILGTKSRPAGQVPQDIFRTGQTIVVQPNVVTRDRKAGVQTGELLVITNEGVELLHQFPRGFEAVYG